MGIFVWRHLDERADDRRRRNLRQSDGLLSGRNAQDVFDDIVVPIEVGLIKLARKERLEIRLCRLPRDFCVSDESARGILGIWLWEHEIEDAYAEFLLAAVCTSVACANHKGTPIGSRLAKVNHGMSHGRVGIHSISTNPEQKISRTKCIQFKAVGTITNDRMKTIRLAHPHVLGTGRSWDVLYSHRLQQEVDCA